LLSESTFPLSATFLHHALLLDLAFKQSAPNVVALWCMYYGAKPTSEMAVLLLIPPDCCSVDLTCW
jgi:hypothetical protein